MRPKTALVTAQTAVTDAIGRAVFAWADATTDATSERRDDLLRDKTRSVEMCLGFTGKRPEQLTPDDIKAWQTDLESRGLAPATVYAMLSRVSSFYRWAAKDPALAPYFSANPVRLAMPKSPRAYQSDAVKSLDDDQLEKLLEQARKRAGQHPAGRRDYAMLVFYVLTGMRREEIARLRWGDLQPGDFLRFTTRVKGGEKVTVEVRHQFVWKALVDYLTESGRLESMAADTPLWTRHDRAGRPGKRLTSHAFVKNLKRMAKLAGLDHIHLHQTRHTYGRIVAETSGSMTETQEALGHKNLATTRNYVRRITVKRDKFSDAVAERAGLK